MTSRAHTADDPLRVRHTPTSPGRGIPPRRHRSPGHKETPAACLRSPLPPCPPAPSLRCCSHCCWRLLLLLLRRRRRCRRRRRRCCCRFHRSSPFLFIPSVPRRRMYVRGRCHRVIRDAAAPCRPRGCMQCLPQPSGVCSCLLCAEQRCVCRRGDVVSSEVHIGFFCQNRWQVNSMAVYLRARRGFRCLSLPQPYWQCVQSLGTGREAIPGQLYTVAVTKSPPGQRPRKGARTAEFMMTRPLYGRRTSFKPSHTSPDIIR